MRRHTMSVARTSFSDRYLNMMLLLGSILTELLTRIRLQGVSTAQGVKRGLRVCLFVFFFPPVRA
jgi:hypothetical protein